MLPETRLLLTRVYNKIMEAARDHGDERDPLTKWARKANELLEKCFVSVYVEAETDVGMLNEEYAFADVAPTLYGFAGVSLACRCALDLRTALNEGYAQVAMPGRGGVFCSSTVPVRPPEVVEFTVCEVLQSLILKGPALPFGSVVKMARNAFSGEVKRLQWANVRGVAAAWVALREAGLVRGQESNERQEVPDAELTPEAREKKRRLLDLPVTRRQKQLRISALEPPQ